jgi:DNA-directed RNA polymerase subunit RPC12/RpoP
MSTVEIACGRCEKKFKVRSEFAGRSTRCPGCSAPITIAAAARPAPPRPIEEEEKPRSRPVPRDDEDDAARGPVLNWKATGQAFAREQATVIFALVSIFGGFLTFCLGQMSRAPGMSDEPILILIMLLFGIGPSLGTAACALIARVSAIGVPSETVARGSAWASLFCAVAALLSLIAMGISMLTSIESQQHDELPLVVATGALVISTIAALFTFAGYTAQVGIYQRSPAVSRGVGRIAVAAAVCVTVLIGIGLLYTLAHELTSPQAGYRDPYGRGGYSYYPDHSGFYAAMTGLLMPLSMAVLLILYHRLLAAGRRAIENDRARQ